MKLSLCKGGQVFDGSCRHCRAIMNPPPDHRDREYIDPADVPLDDDEYERWPKKDAWERQERDNSYDD